MNNDELDYAKPKAHPDKKREQRGVKNTHDRINSSRSQLIGIEEDDSQMDSLLQGRTKSITKIIFDTSSRAGRKFSSKMKDSIDHGKDLRTGNRLFNAGKVSINSVENETGFVDLSDIEESYENKQDGNKISIRKEDSKAALNLDTLLFEEELQMNSLLQGKKKSINLNVVKSLLDDSERGESSTLDTLAKEKESQMDSLLQGRAKSVIKKKSIVQMQGKPRTKSILKKNTSKMAAKSIMKSPFKEGSENIRVKEIAKLHKAMVTEEENQVMNKLLQGKLEKTVIPPTSNKGDHACSDRMGDFLKDGSNKEQLKNSIQQVSSGIPERKKTLRWSLSIDSQSSEKLCSSSWLSPLSSESRMECPSRNQSISSLLSASSLEAVVSISDFSSSPSRLASLRSSLKRVDSTMIEDKETLDTRWSWKQLIAAKQFLPYKKMLAVNDENLPDPDDIENFERDMRSATNARVRNSMLMDEKLNEQQVAAFFEGLDFFDIKVKALESQLEALKTIQRKPDMNDMIRRHSIVGHGSRSFVQANSGTNVDLRRRRLSIRAQSIMKLQKEKKDDKEVQRLLTELQDAEKKQKKLEKQLQQAGVVIAEDIPYDEAKEQIERIAKRMNEIGSSEVTHEDKKAQAQLRQEYFSLEQEMEKYNAAFILTDEYIAEQEKLEHKWEDDNANDNLEALKKLRRHMPVDVKALSEAQLCNEETPNDKYLPKAMAKKFKRTNVLQLIRVNPDDIVRMHPSTLENFRVTGLTLTERRAIYAHLKEVGPRWKSMQADKMTERKWTWFKMMKQNFKENLERYQHHVKQYGPPGNHPYATRTNPNQGCPLIGKQCPLKADKIIDYDGDYGYTEGVEYEESNVKKAEKEDPGAKATREALELSREKKANERSESLRKHYKGKILLVSFANGSCESMDESMDRMEFLRTKWIEESLIRNEDTNDSHKKELSAFNDALNELKFALLGFAERSGMQVTGKRDANANNPDIRSPLELGLSEEFCEFSFDFFEEIQDRMDEMKTKDGRLKSTVSQLRELMDELHERNVATLKELETERPERIRKLKSRSEIKREIKKKIEAIKPIEEEEEILVLTKEDTGGRGGLMSSIAGRGGSGRGGLMSAITGRGGGGRGGLMSAIAGRGRGHSISQSSDSNRRGDLVSTTADRGCGNDAGGRGNLMSAIAARGRGRGSGRDVGVGRGGLMAAIAARGGRGS